MTITSQQRTKEHKEVKDVHSSGNDGAEGLQQLVYMPTDKLESSEDHFPTMVLMVDVAMYRKWQTDKSIALASVVDSFKVLKYDTGRSGLLSQPSQSELDAVFGTTDTTRIVQQMLEKGELHHKAM